MIPGEIYLIQCRSTRLKLFQSKDWIKINKLYCLLYFYLSGLVSMFACFSMLGTDEGYIHMFPARICFSLILSPITNLSLTLLCTNMKKWPHENETSVARVKKTNNTV
jgi:hypothetical protein